MKVIIYVKNMQWFQLGDKVEYATQHYDGWICVETNLQEVKFTNTGDRGKRNLVQLKINAANGRKNNTT